MFIMDIAGDFLFGRNSSGSCLDSSNAKADYIAKAFHLCGGEGEREGKKGDLGLGFTMTYFCVDDSRLWVSEGPDLHRKYL